MLENYISKNIIKSYHELTFLLWGPGDFFLNILKCIEHTSVKRSILRFHPQVTYYKRLCLFKEGTKGHWPKKNSSRFFHFFHLNSSLTVDRAGGGLPLGRPLALSSLSRTRTQESPGTHTASVWRIFFLSSDKWISEYIYGLKIKQIFLQVFKYLEC